MATFTFLVGETSPTVSPSTTMCLNEMLRVRLGELMSTLATRLTCMVVRAMLDTVLLILRVIARLEIRRDIVSRISISVLNLKSGAVSNECGVDEAMNELMVMRLPITPDVYRVIPLRRDNAGKNLLTEGVSSSTIPHLPRHRPNSTMVRNLILWEPWNHPPCFHNGILTGGGFFAL